MQRIASNLKLSVYNKASSELRAPSCLGIHPPHSSLSNRASLQPTVSMSKTINLRARYPNGSVQTLRDLPTSTSYTDLLQKLAQAANLPDDAPEKVLQAGPPPVVIEESGETEIGAFLRNGDCLIVEPKQRKERKKDGGRGTRRGRKSLVEKAEEKLRKREEEEKRKKGGIVAVRDIRRKDDINGGDMDYVDDDDGDDEDWELEGIEDEVEVERRRKKRRRTSEEGARVTRKGVKRRAAAEANEKMKDDAGEKDTGVDLLDTVVQRGKIGAAVVNDLLGKGSGAFKKSLQESLKARQEEALGERRYTALCGGWYRFEDGDDGFQVEFRGEIDGRWEKEMDGKVFAEYPKEVLREAIREIVRGEESKEKLRVYEMAKYSAGVFWNMARLFEGDVERGLRELVPEVDWGFLNVRKREMSKKGRESLRNKEMMEAIDVSDEEDRY